MPIKLKDAEATSAKKKTAKVEKEKVTANIEAAAPVVENAEGVVFGSKSETIAFLNPLGDPSKPDSTPQTMPDGTTKTVVTSTIVGYRFQALEDVEVPDVEAGDDIKTNLMSYVGDPMKTRPVKKGETFDLTKFETAMLISRDEYNGSFTGGTMSVSCSYNFKAKKTSAGTVAKASTAAVPTIALKSTTSGASIKDAKMIDVLTCVSHKEGKITKNTRTINPGFEKWAGLCKKAVRATAGGVSQSNKRNANAQAFLAIFNNKKAPAAPAPAAPAAK